MPTINFHKQFAPGVRAGVDPEFKKRSGFRAKVTTIRANRKRPFKKGDKLYLYTGLRTKYSHKIGEAECTKVEDCKMYFRDSVFSIELDGKTQSDLQLEKIAKLDGFKYSYDFMRWFETNHGIPFHGQRIHWQSTYKRKYYLHNKVKLSGFKIDLNKTERTILVPDHRCTEASENKYIDELKNLHSYGVQLTKEI